jgi:hypothetical protein
MIVWLTPDKAPSPRPSLVAAADLVAMGIPGLAGGHRIANAAELAVRRSRPGRGEVRRVASRGAVIVDGVRRGARSFVLALLRALCLVPLLAAVQIGCYPGRAGGELVGEVVRGPVRGWGVQGVGAGAGAAHKAQSSPFRVGEQVALLDLSVLASSQPCQ